MAQAKGQAAASLAERALRLQDRAEIHAVMVNYGRLIDSKNFDAFGKLWARDGVYVLGGTDQAKGPDAINKMMGGFMTGPNVPKGFHVFFNEVIEHVEGDTASAYSRGTYVVAGPDGQPTWAVIVHYDDTFVREDGKWKFQRRFITNDLPFKQPTVKQ